MDKNSESQFPKTFEWRLKFRSTYSKFELICKGRIYNCATEKKYLVNK